MSKCENCGEELPTIRDAFCSFCREPIGNTSDTTTEEPCNTPSFGVMPVLSIFAIAICVLGTLVLIGSELLDLVAVDPARDAISPVASIISILATLAIGGGLSYGFFNLFQRFQSPEKHSPNAKLVAILSETEEIVTSHVESENSYSNARDWELPGIYRLLKNQNEESKLAELVAEVRFRLADNESPPIAR